MTAGMLLVAGQLAYFSRPRHRSDLDALARFPARRVRDGDDDDLERRGRDTRRPGREGRRRPAVLNAFRQGGSIGIAVMGRSWRRSSWTRRRSTFMRGFERSLLVAAGSLAGALVAAWLIRPHDTTQSAGGTAAAAGRGGERDARRHGAWAMASAGRRSSGALRVFTSVSYAGATTAEGNARPASASLSLTGTSRRSATLARLPRRRGTRRGWCWSRRSHLRNCGDADRGSPPWRSPTMPNLWIQGLTEVGETSSFAARSAGTCARCTTSSPTSFVRDSH